jgi:hypothetical protein
MHIFFEQQIHSFKERSTNFIELELYKTVLIVDYYQFSVLKIILQLWLP